jgi:hypothetical protein
VLSPGRANLPIGGWQRAIQENGVPGFPGQQNSTLKKVQFFAGTSHRTLRVDARPVKRYYAQHSWVLG